MAWWAWMIVAAISLAFEMFVLDAQFYLVFFGVSAAVIGFLGLAGVNMPDWAQWLSLSVLAVISMLTFRKRAYAARAQPHRPVSKSVLTVGDRVTVPVRLEPFTNLPRRLSRLFLDCAQCRCRRRSKPAARP